jgi:hypothetical protein
MAKELNAGKIFLAFRQGSIFSPDILDIGTKSEEEPN